MKAAYFVIIASLFLSSTSFATSLCRIRGSEGADGPYCYVLCDAKDEDVVSGPITEVVKGFIKRGYRIVAAGGESTVYVQKD